MDTIDRPPFPERLRALRQLIQSLKKDDVYAPKHKIQKGHIVPLYKMSSQERKRALGDTNKFINHRKKRYMKPKNKQKKYELVNNKIREVKPQVSLQKGVSNSCKPISRGNSIDDKERGRKSEIDTDASHFELIQNSDLNSENSNLNSTGVTDSNIDINKQKKRKKKSKVTLGELETNQNEFVDNQKIDPDIEINKPKKRKKNKVTLDELETNPNKNTDNQDCFEEFDSKQNETKSSDANKQKRKKKKKLEENNSNSNEILVGDTSIQTQNDEVINETICEKASDLNSLEHKGKKNKKQKDKKKTFNNGEIVQNKECSNPTELNDTVPGNENGLELLQHKVKKNKKQRNKKGSTTVDQAENPECTNQSEKGNTAGEILAEIQGKKNKKLKKSKNVEENAEEVQESRNKKRKSNETDSTSLEVSNPKKRKKDKVSLDELKADQQNVSNNTNEPIKKNKGKRKGNESNLNDKKIADGQSEIYKKTDRKLIKNKKKTIKRGGKNKRANDTENLNEDNIAYKIDESIEVIYMSGHPISKDDAKKITRDFVILKNQNISQEKINLLLRVMMNKAEKKLMKEKNKICYKCRRFGHSTIECSVEKETMKKICWKCGVKSHVTRDCELQNDEFPFAECPVCLGKGHIAKQCYYKRINNMNLLDDRKK